MGYMIGFGSVWIGSIVFAFALLAKEENFLWHLGGFLGIAIGATLLTGIVRYPRACKALLGKAKAPLLTLWEKLCFPLAAAVLSGLVWSWYYLLTVWSGFFMIQGVGIVATAVLGVLAVVWILSGPRKEPPPYPSRMDLHRERQGTFSKM